MVGVQREGQSSLNCFNEPLKKNPEQHPTAIDMSDISCQKAGSNGRKSSTKEHLCKADSKAGREVALL
jgi:hypothetical protein